MEEGWTKETLYVTLCLSCNKIILSHAREMLASCFVNLGTTLITFMALLQETGINLVFWFSKIDVTIVSFTYDI